MTRCAVLAILAASPLLPQTSPTLPADAPILFEHVSVIDATGGPERKNVSVFVSDGRIVKIAAKITAPRGIRKIDARGKYLIPGLWDMHVHLGPPDLFFPVLLANGITGIREMYTGNPPAALIPLRNRPDAPRILVPAFLDGPRMLSNGPPPPGAAAVGTPEQARYAVRAFAASGADFLKVYNSIPRDAYFAIADEARKIGIPFVGHVPEEVSPAEAAVAGQKSQEHLINILLACSTRETELRAQRLEIMNTNAISGQERLRELGFPRLEGLADTYSEEKCATLFQTFVTYGIWHTPTLVVLKGFGYGDAFAIDPRMASQPRAIRETSYPRKKYYMQDLSDEAYAAFQQRVRALLDRYKKLVGDMHRAGVQFLAGTDVNVDTPVMIGAGLHDELELLVQSGLSPMEALQTATLNPARFLGMQASMGTIEAGKFADLVLLDADPLQDIRNTQNIRAVVKQGRYFDRTELDEMVKRAAN